LTPFDEAGLWAVIDGKRFQVKDSQGKPVLVREALSLSPDGRYVVAMAAAKKVPEEWAKYKAPPGYEHLPVNSSAYHLIELKSGSMKLLVNAPTGRNHDWNSRFWSARWSPDGRSLVLPNTFLPLDVTDQEEKTRRETHPCVSVLRLATEQISCVLPIKAGLDKERYGLSDVGFESDDTVVVDFDRSYYMRGSAPSAIFSRVSDGTWKQVPGAEDPKLRALPIKVEVKQDVNHPPVVVAEDKTRHKPQPVWDPNPQLGDIELGQAEVIKGTDDHGNEWEGGLVKPPDYVPGRQYPLVIQTHGFFDGTFLSNGVFNSSTFAARALAASGMVVLQLDWIQNLFSTPEEGPAEVAVFESAVKKLTAEGLIDPARVGVIGFSRTVYHVLEALTTRKIFAAASVTDGITFGYFDYILNIESPYVRESDMVYGGDPFRAPGLENYLKRSPGFNMDKVSAPLLVLNGGKDTVLGDWEPYAALRVLNKPVELIMMQDGTHVLSNPQQRLFSETTQVDWFRFWLKGEEDADPAKTEQYVRWRKLRHLQDGSKPPTPVDALRR
jgi:hypothetical protein